MSAVTVTSDTKTNANRQIQSQTCRLAKIDTTRECKGKAEQENFEPLVTERKDSLLVGLDMTDLTTVGTLSRGTASLQRLSFGGHRSIATAHGLPVAALLFFALLTSLLVLLKAFFFLADPVERGIMR